MTVAATVAVGINLMYNNAVVTIVMFSCIQIIIIIIIIIINITKKLLLF